MAIESGLFFYLFLIGQYHCSSETYNTFRCHNGSETSIVFGDYIPDDLFCDGSNTCDDGEDEYHGCRLDERDACGTGKFQCDGKKCKNITARCNTIKDCKDGTDESNCGDEIHVKNCTSDDKFLCKDGLRCLGVEYTCDGVCNCFDCSDENGNCSKIDNDLYKKCPHSYFATSNGPRCFCESINASSSISCNRVKDCQDTYGTGCDQRCIVFKRKTQCTCYDGYALMYRGCRTAENFIILYTTARSIKSMNNTSQESSTILYGIANCTALTAANNYGYYAILSHDNKGSIFKTWLSNSEKAERLIERDFAITSIAVDYVTNNVYFTSNGSLSVCTNDGRICTQLKGCNVDGIIEGVRILRRWMFYMQRQMDPKRFDCELGYFLTRSNMDGSNEIIRDRDCYRGEVLLEMDESKNMIYLLETNDFCKVYKISVDSVFQSVDMKNTYTFITTSMRSFSFHSGEIFFTMYEKPTIFYLTKHELKRGVASRIDSTKLYLHDNNTSAISNLYVYNAATQRNVRNPCDESSCSGLCLLKPAEVQPSQQYILNHKCFTPSNHTLTKGSNHTNYGAVWVCLVTFVLVLLILAGAGYYIFNKYNWYGYFLTFKPLNRRRSESHEVMIFRNQEEEN